MEHKLLKDPDFDFDGFRAAVADWKNAGAAGMVIEWYTGPGPTVVYYPGDDRRLGRTWRAAVSATRYNELYADWIEKTLIPRLIELAQGNQLSAAVRCADQQPIQVMRQRRREIETAQAAVAAH